MKYYRVVYRLKSGSWCEESIKAMCKQDIVINKTGLPDGVRIIRVLQAGHIKNIKGSLALSKYPRYKQHVNIPN